MSNTTKNALLTAVWCIIGSVAILAAIYVIGLEDVMDYPRAFPGILKIFKVMACWSYSKVISIATIVAICAGLIRFGPGLARWIRGTAAPAGAVPRSDWKFSTVLDFLLGALVVLSVLTALATIGSIFEYLSTDSVKWIMVEIDEWYDMVVTKLLMVAAALIILGIVVYLWKKVTPLITPYIAAVFAHIGPVIWAWATSRNGIISILVAVLVLIALGAGFVLWLFL